MEFLSSVSFGDKTTIAAFKALPVENLDTGGSGSGSGSRSIVRPAKRAANCQEAVDEIVSALEQACEDVGAVHGEHFVVEKDIVRYEPQTIHATHCHSNGFVPPVC